jgi:Tol biopolymer transport system component
LVNWRTGQAKPVPTRNDNHFQMHSSWSHDGRYIYYHGRDRATAAPIGTDGGGHFIGAASVDGAVVWEQVFPHFYYGHVAGHSRRNVLLFDSLTTPDLIQEVAFLEPGAPIRVLGRHGSEVRYGRQETHPHLQMSPDGRCIAYQRATAGRSDVCVLWVGDDFGE